MMKKIHIARNTDETIPFCGNTQGTQDNVWTIDAIIYEAIEPEKVCKTCKQNYDKKETAMPKKTRQNVTHSTLSPNDEMLAEHEAYTKAEAKKEKEEEIMKTAKKEIKETLVPTITMKIARVKDGVPVVVKEYSTDSIKVARGFSVNPTNISLGNILVKETATEKLFFQRQDNRWVPFTPNNPDAI